MHLNLYTKCLSPSLSTSERGAPGRFTSVIGLQRRDPLALPRCLYMSRAD